MQPKEYVAHQNLPVSQIEQRKDQWKGDPEDDIDPLGASRELGHPQSTATLPLWSHEHLALPHLRVQRATTHQRLLWVADQVRWNGIVGLVLWFGIDNLTYIELTTLFPEMEVVRHYPTVTFIHTHARLFKYT